MVQCCLLRRGVNRWNLEVPVTRDLRVIFFFFYFVCSRFFVDDSWDFSFSAVAIRVESGILSSLTRMRIVRRWRGNGGRATRAFDFVSTSYVHCIRKLRVIPLISFVFSHSREWRVIGASINLFARIVWPLCTSCSCKIGWKERKCYKVGEFSLQSICAFPFREHVCDAMQFLLRNQSVERCEWARQKRKNRVITSNISSDLQFQLNGGEFLAVIAPSPHSPLTHPHTHMHTIHLISILDVCESFEKNSLFSDCEGESNELRLDVNVIAIAIANEAFPKTTHKLKRKMFYQRKLLNEFFVRFILVGMDMALLRSGFGCAMSISRIFIFNWYIRISNGPHDAGLNAIVYTCTNRQNHLITRQLIWFYMYVRRMGFANWLL